MKKSGLAIMTCVLIALGCVRAPEWPMAESIEWKRYENVPIGYSFDVPAQREIDETAGGTLIRYRGGPIIAINFVTEREGRERGLWSGHDAVGKASLGGRDGALYMYSHFDGPLSMPVISYVVPHRGKFLGLEFRVAGTELGPIQRHVLGSFVFTSE